MKILRFLQERTIERMGGRQPIAVDLRVIAATNRDLKAISQQGLFREDLYYRLSVVTIDVPPLRERGEDVLILANALPRAGREGAPAPGALRPEALQALMAHNWPGNVRELENRVSRAVIMSRGASSSPRTSTSPREPAHRARSARPASGWSGRPWSRCSSRHRGNVSQAARELKVSRPTLHGLLDKHRSTRRTSANEPRASDQCRAVGL